MANRFRLPRKIFWGCHPRAEGTHGRLFGDGHIRTYAERDLKPIPPEQWKDVNPKYHVWHIFGQLDGMCTSNAMAQGLMVLREMCGLPRVELSPEDLYRHVGRWGSGSNLPDNIEAASSFGVATVNTIPHGWPVRATDKSKAEAKQYRLLKDEWTDLNGRWDMIVSSAQRAHPVLLGVKWPGGGGHCVLVTGYRKSDNKVLGPNSWKKTYGDEGHFELTERECRSAEDYGAYALRAVTEADADPHPPEPV